jgi:hypothetical protein
VFFALLIFRHTDYNTDEEVNTNKSLAETGDPTVPEKGEPDVVKRIPLPGPLSTGSR